LTRTLSRHAVRTDGVPAPTAGLGAGYRRRRTRRSPTCRPSRPGDAHLCSHFRCTGQRPALAGRLALYCTGPTESSCARGTVETWCSRAYISCRRWERLSCPDSRPGGLTRRKCRSPSSDRVRARAIDIALRAYGTASGVTRFDTLAQAWGGRTLIADGRWWHGIAPHGVRRARSATAHPRRPGHPEMRYRINAMVKSGGVGRSRQPVSIEQVVGVRRAADDRAAFRS